MFQGTQEPFLKKERFLALIISGNLWSDLLELFQGTKDEFPISHSQSLEAYKNEFGCVDKFVHRSNCVDELNTIKLPACHESLLAELSRFFLKKDLRGKTNLLHNFHHHHLSPWRRD